MEHQTKAFRHLDEHTFNWSDFFCFPHSLSSETVWASAETFNTKHWEYEREKLWVPLWFQCSFSYWSTDLQRFNKHLFYVYCSERNNKTTQWLEAQQALKYSMKARPWIFSLHSQPREAVELLPQQGGAWSGWWKHQCGCNISVSLQLPFHW